MNSVTEDLYGFLGHNIGVSSNSLEILAHLRAVYARFRRTSETALFTTTERNTGVAHRRIEITDNAASTGEIVIKDGFRSYRLRCTNGDRCGRPDGDPLGWVQWFLLWTASTLAKDYFFVHAGAVASRHGGMIFPADSGMGKTTLTIRLVQKGLKFLSDEVACINGAQRRMVPFPRRINLTDDSRVLLGLPPWSDVHVRLEGPEGTKWMVDMEDIAADSLADPCTPRYAFFLKGFGEKPRLEPVSPFHALCQSLRFPIGPVADLSSQIFTCAPVFNDMQCFNLVMGDLDATAELILRLAEQGESQNG